MLALLLAAQLATTTARLAAPPPAAPPPACREGCVPGQTCYTLVLRWQENLAMPGQAPVLVVQETFTAENYPTRAAALCAARRMRREGAELPVEAHGGASGNVMPDSITPMPVI